MFHVVMWLCTCCVRRYTRIYAPSSRTCLFSGRPVTEPRSSISCVKCARGHCQHRINARTLWCDPICDATLTAHLPSDMLAMRTSLSVLGPSVMTPHGLASWPVTPLQDPSVSVSCCIALLGNNYNITLIGCSFSLSIPCNCFYLQEGSAVVDPVISREAMQMKIKGTHRYKIVNNRPKPQVTQRIRWLFSLTFNSTISLL